MASAAHGNSLFWESGTLRTTLGPSKNCPSFEENPGKKTPPTRAFAAGRVFALGFGQAKKGLLVQGVPGIKYQVQEIVRMGRFPILLQIVCLTWIVVVGGGETEAVDRRKVLPCRSNSYSDRICSNSLPLLSLLLLPPFLVAVPPPGTLGVLVSALFTSTSFCALRFPPRLSGGGKPAPEPVLRCTSQPCCAALGCAAQNPYYAKHPSPVLPNIPHR